MTRYDKPDMTNKARELGFVRDTLEKVCRLADILSYMETEPLLADNLALKGGTAINLAVFDFPRLSVDIDLDYVKEAKREAMFEEREQITEKVHNAMTGMGYSVHPQTKRHHALDSLLYAYKNTGGVRDKIKIEINYILRSHILEDKIRRFKLPWSDKYISVRCLDPIEIFASKIMALLNRGKARDLWDVWYLYKSGLLSDGDKQLLRRCTVFYAAIGSKEVPKEFSFEKIWDITQLQVKTDLDTVVRKREKFNLAVAQAETTEFLQGFLKPTDNERAFWEAFERREYRPELVFPEPEYLERIKNHPMALWKCGM